MEIKKFAPTTHKVKAVVYGASGSGKTVLGGTAPNPIFASAEGGLLSIADKEPAFVEIKTLNDLKSLLAYLQKEKHDFETVVIDSISEINDIIKMDIERKNGRAMQLQDWGTLAKEIKAIFRGFRDLPMHVLFIAQETSEKDEDVVVKIVPSLNGKAATEIAYFMDIVGYIYIEKATGERKIVTLPSSKLLTKDRTNLIGNDSPVDFNGWVEIVKGIKLGEQKVLAEVKDASEVPEGKPLPQPAKPAAKSTEPMVDDKTGKELFAAWNEMWSLYMEKMPNEVDSEGALKYTKEKSDPTRKVTMQKLFQVDSSTNLTLAQAKELIKRTKDKIKELKKLPTPEVQPEAPAEDVTTDNTDSAAEVAEAPVEETPVQSEESTAEEAAPTETEEPAFGQ